jgi:hypothetical protein
MKVSRRSARIEAGAVGCASADEEHEPPACGRCGSSLELHQPDADLPNRLLGTCPACKAWYVVEGEDRARRIPIIATESALRATSAC